MNFYVNENGVVFEMLHNKFNLPTVSLAEANASCEWLEDGDCITNYSYAVTEDTIICNRGFASPYECKEDIINYEV